MQKAILLWELKRNDEASKLLDKLVVDYPESDKVKYLAGFGAERIEKTERALELYAMVPETSQLRHDADMRTLLILQKLKRWDQAIERGKAALETSAATWETYGVVGGIYGDAERYEDAIRTFDAGAAKFPDKPRLLFLKGVYQEKAGAREDCIATMREVIAKDPENSSAFNYLGYLFAERGENLDEAEKLVSRALELKPDDGFYLDSLGWVHYQKGEYDKALSLLKLASTKEPEEGVILEHVGDALLKKGDKAGAKKLYETALTKKLDPKDKTRMEQKLKDLTP